MTDFYLNREVSMILTWVRDKDGQKNKPQAVEKIKRFDEVCNSSSFLVMGIFQLKAVLHTNHFILSTVICALFF